MTSRITNYHSFLNEGIPYIKDIFRNYKYLSIPRLYLQFSASGTTSINTYLDFNQIAVSTGQAGPVMIRDATITALSYGVDFVGTSEGTLAAGILISKLVPPSGSATTIFTLGTDGGSRLIANGSLPVTTSVTNLNVDVGAGDIINIITDNEEVTTPSCIIELAWRLSLS